MQTQSLKLCRKCIQIFDLSFSLSLTVCICESGSGAVHPAHPQYRCQSWACYSWSYGLCFFVEELAIPFNSDWLPVGLVFGVPKS